MAGGGSAAGKGNAPGVRIVVAGDAKTGKSSLILTAATDSYPSNVPPVLPPTRLPDDIYPDRVPVTIIDTSSSPENRGKLVEELKRADAVVLTYACDKPATLDRLSTFWLPELRRLEVRVPVIVVGCMLDKRDEQIPVSLEQVMSPIMQQFREIETCIECSAYRHIQIPEVFYYAQKAVLHPTAPLFDQEAQTLKPRCVRALKRIFILCDLDRDGALSDAELNDFQVKCFNAPLQPSEIVGVKRVVQDKLPDGVNERGLTLTGFLFLHALFIEKGRLETTWTVLRKFGYNNEIRLSEDQLPTPIKRQPDQSVELTNEALDFLRRIFHTFDIDSDEALRSNELDDLFSTAPENPWSEAPYKDAAEKDALGGLSLDGFLSEWALMTLLDPIYSVENLIYIGYAGEPSSAIRITRRRRLDRKKQQSDRNVYQCFVFGPKEAGKSAILNSFIGRPFPEEYESTTADQYGVNIVDLGGTKKTLVLREIPEDGVKKLLSSKDALADCDIALFVHDSSCEASWKRAADLLVDVASHGEATGHEVPCLIVAAKDDLDPYLTEIQDSTRVSQDLGIEAPIPISTKLGDFSNLFRRIVNAAEHPHLSIPETEAGRSRKQYHRLINRSLMFVSVGAAVAVVGLAAYRVYAARKNASS
ncbi:mitochondrial Rho GTPase 1 [Nicotiana tomentosiformis]|uniref:mitochondrial Rho GTPase 1 n=1 Tax=Nicotiana tomentosiformis TaxID=4098 RepID=UPI00051C06FC|nr:mitochondrial Rho GTPase 1 [Nicotiana tomentosiformis]XP_009625702.1 mitochondrial Rho GTPase 1 [Nicotiana tomentosiformis]